MYCKQAKCTQVFYQKIDEFPVIFVTVAYAPDAKYEVHFFSDLKLR